MSEIKKYVDAEQMISDTEAMRQVSEAIMIDGIIKYINENSIEISSQQKQECVFHDDDGNVITRCVKCGIELSPHNLVLEDTCYGENYCVQILKCKDCGTLSFGWMMIGDSDELSGDS